MTNANSSGWWLGGIGLAVGLVVGYRAAEGPEPNPQERTLDANLWMQTAGEYRACCLQTYRLAGERLEKKLKEAASSKKKFAVIMDLDETVLDNSAFETWLYQHARDFSDDAWEGWEKNGAGEVRLVPGARDFIKKAEDLDVTVVYLSNRSEKNRDKTIDALKQVKLNTDKMDDRLLLLSKEQGGSNKTVRRAKVAAKYRVLMLFGDNLRDFDEKFKSVKVDGDDVSGQNKGIAERLNKVVDAQAHWGDDWIILPNPVYGEWQKLIGRQPLGNMRPTKMKAP